VLNDSLIEFRVAYLRAIAKAWREPSFAQDLLDTSKVTGCLKDLGFDTSTWPCLNVEFVGKGGIWNPSTTGGWFSPGNAGEALTLRLPLEPSIALPPDPQQWTEALAGFYQRYPTLFGTALDKPGSEGQAYPTELGDWQPFLEFGALIVRAIAIAWKDDAFARALSTDAASALESWLGYRFPWNIPLKIEITGSKTKWQPAKDAASNGFWENLPTNTLTLAIPNKPDDSDAKVFPIALAAYNNTGPAYPFTCCI